MWISAEQTPPEDEELWLLIQDCLGGRKWVCMGVYKGQGEWHDLFIGQLDPIRYCITHWQLLVYPEIP